MYRHSGKSRLARFGAPDPRSESPRTVALDPIYIYIYIYIYTHTPLYLYVFICLFIYLCNYLYNNNFPGGSCFRVGDAPAGEGTSPKPLDRGHANKDSG